jgi:hypothetical protein
MVESALDNRDERQNNFLGYLECGSGERLMDHTCADEKKKWRSLQLSFDVTLDSLDFLYQNISMITAGK